MKIIALYNLKGGVGKTTSAVNLAYLAAASGRRTLIWDLDPQAAASFYLATDSELTGKAKKILKDFKDFKQIIEITRYPGLALLPAGPALRHLDLVFEEKKSSKKFDKIIEKLRDDYDLLVFDCPPSFSYLSEVIFQVADLVLTPVVPAPLSHNALQSLRDYFNPAPGKLRPFFSMVDRRKKLHRQLVEQGQSAAEFCRTVIPTAAAVEKMGLHQAPLPVFERHSKALQAFRDLWQEVLATMAP